MGGCANIAGVVVEDEVFEVNKFAVDPQRGAGVGKVRPFDPPLSDRGAGDALVETRQLNAGSKSVASTLLFQMGKLHMSVRFSR